MKQKLRIFTAFILAVVIAGLLGSVFQTQVNLAQLRDIAPPVSFAMRLSNTWHDLTHFAPIYTGLVLATFIIAFTVGELVAKVVPGHRMFWLVLASTTGLATCFWLVDSVAPMPTFIAATRTWGGTGLMLLGAAIASVVYTLMTPSLNAQQDNQESGQ